MEGCVGMVVGAKLVAVGGDARVMTKVKWVILGACVSVVGDKELVAVGGYGERDGCVRRCKSNV